VEVIAFVLDPASFYAGSASPLDVFHDRPGNVAVVWHVVPVAKVARQEFRHDAHPASRPDCQRESVPVLNCMYVVIHLILLLLMMKFEGQSRGPAREDYRVQAPP
jgi:hypothetical protein